MNLALAQLVSFNFGVTAKTEKNQDKSTHFSRKFLVFFKFQILSVMSIFKVVGLLILKSSSFSKSSSCQVVFSLEVLMGLCLFLRPSSSLMLSSYL